MRKFFWVLLWVSGIILVGVITYAQNEQTKEPAKPVEEPPAHHYLQKMTLAPSIGMMRSMSGMPVMAATSDGGVVVLRGNHLMKYDKSMNLIKEVTLPPLMDPKPDKASDHPFSPEAPLPSDAP